MDVRVAEATPTESGPVARQAPGEGRWGRQRLVDSLAFQLDVLAKEMAEAYLTLAECLPAGSALEPLRTSEAVTEQLQHLLRAMAISSEHGPQMGGELTALRAVATELAVAGATLATVVEVVHGALGIPWRAAHEELTMLPAAQQGAERAIAERALFATMTLSTVTVTEAFVAAGTDSFCNGSRSILDEALLGEQRLLSAVHRAERAGWPTSAPHTAMVAVVEQVDPACPMVPLLLRQVRTDMEQRSGGPRAMLSGLRDGQVVMAAPAHGAALVPDPGPWRQLVGAVALPPGYRLLAGVGLAEEGLAGVQRSYEQACRALDVTRIMPGERVIVSYAEALPDLILDVDRSSAEDLTRLVAGAVGDGRVGEELLATLRAYFDCGLNVTATAKRLGVHRHTLTARLERLEQRVGLRLSDGDGRLLLELGLRAARVLGR